MLCFRHSPPGLAAPNLTNPQFNPLFVHPSFWMNMQNHVSQEIGFWYGFAFKYNHRFQRCAICHAAKHYCKTCLLVTCCLDENSFLTLFRDCSWRRHVKPYRCLIHITDASYIVVFSFPHFNHKWMKLSNFFYESFRKFLSNLCLLSQNKIVSSQKMSAPTDTACKFRYIYFRRHSPCLEWNHVPRYNKTIVPLLYNNPFLQVTFQVRPWTFLSSVSTF